jgi:negative regulator of flagellin synthesis FlgM
VKVGNPLEIFRTGAPAGGAAAPDADKTAAPPSQPAKNEGSATVKLSSGLATLKANVSADGAFDANRVEQLRAPIANGSFRVNAEVVATRVIASNLEALTRSVR